MRFGAVLLLGAALTLTSCETAEPRPAGVGVGISFRVTPLYPKSFDITAFGSRLRDGHELQEAWLKKAKMVAAGRRYNITKPPVLHNDESDYGYGPDLSRSVSGTIVLLD